MVDRARLRRRAMASRHNVDALYGGYAVKLQADFIEYGAILACATRRERLARPTQG